MDPIRKPPAEQMSPPPLLADYEAARRDFSWSRVDEDLGLRPDAPSNLGALAARHPAAPGPAERVALRWYGAGGERETCTYAELAARAAKFANVLQNFGVQRGDRVFFLARNVPDLYWGVLGTLLYGAVAGLLNPLGNADYARNVLSRSGARLLVVDAAYKTTVDSFRKSLPELWQVLVLVRGKPPERLGAGDFLYADYFGPAPETFAPASTPGDEAALLHYTDIGMTGAVNVHGLAAALLASTRSALDLRPGDVVAPVFLPGEPAFLAYAILGPVLAGAAVVAFEDPARVISYPAVLADTAITTWFSTFRAVELLLRQDSGLGAVFEEVRHIAVTHPYEPGFVEMTQSSWRSPIHPVWWDRELGAIQCAELRGFDIRPGSIGRPLPGVDVREIDGKLAVRLGRNAGFAGYWQDPARTAGRIREGWFVTTHDVRIDPAGYVWI